LSRQSARSARNLEKYTIALIVLTIALLVVGVITIVVAA
jgi:hypothetical protein